MTHRVLKSHRSKMNVIYVIDTYIYIYINVVSANDPMVTHALGHIMYIM